MWLLSSSVQGKVALSMMKPSSHHAPPDSQRTTHEVQQSQRPSRELLGSFPQSLTEQRSTGNPSPICHAP